MHGEKWEINNILNLNELHFYDDFMLATKLSNNEQRNLMSFSILFEFYF